MSQQRNLTIQEALNWLVRLYNAGQFAETEQLAKEMLQSAPTLFALHHMLGAALAGQNQLDAAVASIERAIQFKPGSAELHNDLGNVLQMQGKLEAAAAYLQHAIQCNPNLATAQYNLGHVLQTQGKLDAAMACYENAIGIRPDHAKAHYNLANVLREKNQFAEAIRHYQQAIQSKPEYTAAINMLNYTLCIICDWAGRDEMLARLKQAFLQFKTDDAISTFPLLAVFDDPALHLQASRAYAAQYKTLRLRSPNPPETARIKIGYLSADFKEHPVAYLMAEVFELHDREKFEIYGLSYRANIPQTPIRLRLQQGFEHFLDVSSMNNAELLDLIERLGIHILVDLTGYTGETRSGILASRPAPVQVQYLGYPGTLGADFIDYMIADAVVIPPECRQYYSENIVFMPHSSQPNDRKREIATSIPSRQECGLPEHGFIFCCFNNSYKITPEQFELWRRILHAVPGSVLWLANTNETAVKNLRQETETRGIGCKRIIFAQRTATIAEHLARFQQADLFLDTFPFNAYTTASDSLWAGVPVLTRPGKSLVSRVAASLLYALEMPELVTVSAEEYVEKAVYLAKNPGLLKELKAKIAANKNTAPLFNTPLFVRHLEMAYLKMWEGYKAGQAPQDIML
jgi:predicted O-linked N-acetylglucosamine transferase (SPINDLY family)